MWNASRASATNQENVEFWNCWTLIARRRRPVCARPRSTHPHARQKSNWNLSVDGRCHECEGCDRCNRCNGCLRCDVLPERGSPRLCAASTAGRGRPGAVTERDELDG